MKTVKLYRFKNSVTQKIPLLRDGCMLTSLNDIMGIDIINTEKITEYSIDVPDDFNFENYDDDQLLQLCNASIEVIEHHFTTTQNDDDVV